MDERNLIIEEHIKLVYHVAYDKYKSFMIYEDDDKKQELINEGCLGLVRAHELFNVDLGYQFSTYATRWIWGRMHRYFENINRSKTKENKLTVYDKAIILDRSHEEREYVDLIQVKSDEGIVDLMNYLSSLNEEEKELCEMLIQGYSIKEISLMLNMEYRSTHWIVNKLRNKIRKEYLKCS